MSAYKCGVSVNTAQLCFLTDRTIVKHTTNVLKALAFPKTQSLSQLQRISSSPCRYSVAYCLYGDRFSQPTHRLSTGMHVRLQNDYRSDIFRGTVSVFNVFSRQNYIKLLSVSGRQSGQHLKNR